VVHDDDGCGGTAATVDDIMVKVDDVFSMEINTRLTPQMIQQLAAEG